MLGPWARGRQKEVLAAIKRLVQRVAGEANHGRRRPERGHGRRLVLRSNPERLELNSSDDED